MVCHLEMKSSVRNCKLELPLGQVAVPLRVGTRSRLDWPIIHLIEDHLRLLATERCELDQRVVCSTIYWQLCITGIQEMVSFSLSRGKT